LFPCNRCGEKGIQTLNYEKCLVCKQENQYFVKNHGVSEESWKQCLSDIQDHFNKKPIADTSSSQIINNEISVTSEDVSLERAKVEPKPVDSIDLGHISNADSSHAQPVQTPKRPAMKPDSDIDMDQSNHSGQLEDLINIPEVSKEDITPFEDNGKLEQQPASFSNELKEEVV
jgi:hypothetical protein